MRSKYTPRNIKLHLKINQAYQTASELLTNETFIEEKLRKANIDQNGGKKKLLQEKINQNIIPEKQINGTKER